MKACHVQPQDKACTMERIMQDEIGKHSLILLAKDTYHQVLLLLYCPHHCWVTSPRLTTQTASKWLSQDANATSNAISSIMLVVPCDVKAVYRYLGNRLASSNQQLNVDLKAEMLGNLDQVAEHNKFKHKDDSSVFKKCLNSLGKRRNMAVSQNKGAPV